MTGASSSSDVMEPEISTPPGEKRPRIAVAVLVVVVLLAIGIIPRVLRAREARDIVHASTVLLPEVIVIHPQSAPGQTSLSLPGNLEPMFSASVFARTNGYIEKRFVDIGSHVKAGQTLAIISTPEVDQQLNQARAEVLQAAASLQLTKASLQQAQANLDLARLTRDRYTHLSGTRAVTQQSIDDVVQAFNARTADVAAANANIAVSEANLQSQKANVQRLTQLQGFERVVAPFDGVITARNVEQGSFGYYDVEGLIAANPDALVYGDTYAGTTSLRADQDLHPALMQRYAGRRISYSPLYGCGVPQSADVAKQLQDALRKVQP